MRSNRARLILVALVAAVCVTGVWWGPQAYEWARFRRELYVSYDRDHGYQVGYKLRDRWGSAYKSKSWWLESGFRAIEQYSAGPFPDVTMWNVDGTILLQQDESQGKERRKPPWLWGATDQEEPTLPRWLRQWGEKEEARQRAQQAK